MAGFQYVNELSNMLKCKSPTFEEADAGVVYVGDQPRTWFGCRISIDEIIGVEGEYYRIPHRHVCSNLL
jgi:hypothetical protein